MSAEAVIEAMTALRSAGITAWIGGGWGIDALVGERTRVHRDLDLAIRSEDLEDALRALSALGYETSLDLRPVRLVASAADGRSIDLHPVTFGDDGIGRQPGMSLRAAALRTVSGSQGFSAVAGTPRTDRVGSAS